MNKLKSSCLIAGLMATSLCFASASSEDQSPNDKEAFTVLDPYVVTVTRNDSAVYFEPDFSAMSSTELNLWFIENVQNRKQPNWLDWLAVLKSADRKLYPKFTPLWTDLADAQSPAK